MRSFLCLYVTLFNAHFTALSQSVKVHDAEASIHFVFKDDDVDGTLSDFKFTGAIDLDDLENSVFAGSVASETLDTDNWIRNSMLRGRKYFNAKAFPTITFKSTAIETSGNKLLVKGDLEMKGIRKSVTFIFTRSSNSLKGTATVNTSHWGINVHKNEEQNLVDITITLPYSVK